jgi:hypothetical protein
MSVIFVPRSNWYAGVPTNNSGTPRPLLRLPAPNITRHYTGSPPSSRARTWSAVDVMPWFQTVARASGKSYEYNYVIPPRYDGTSQVWEYAGLHQAAHSSGENDIAIGVLFAIGVLNHPSYSDYNPALPVVWEQITPQMIEAYRWLRDVHLNGLNAVLPSVKEIEHRNMPGAATACPGVSTIAADAQLDAPYGEDDMQELPVPERIYDSRPDAPQHPFGVPVGEYQPGETRKIPVGMCTRAFLRITAVGVGSGEWVSMSGTDVPSPSSVANLDADGVSSGGAPIALPDGHVRVRCQKACHIIVDVFARG